MDPITRLIINAAASPEFRDLGRDERRKLTQRISERMDGWGPHARRDRRRVYLAAALIAAAGIAVVQGTGAITASLGVRPAIGVALIVVLLPAMLITAWTQLVPWALRPIVRGALADCGFMICRGCGHQLMVMDAAGDDDEGCSGSSGGGKVQCPECGAFAKPLMPTST
ncbi:MAG: hypothetical protein AB8G96_01495 [Phycisphaerales bacterium]